MKKVKSKRLSGLTQDQLDEITGRKRLRELAEALALNQQNLLSGFSQSQLDEITGRKRLKKLAEAFVLKQPYLNFPNKINDDLGNDSGDEEE